MHRQIKRRTRIISSFVFIFLLSLTACDQILPEDEPEPTIASIEGEATATFLTQQAPPAGFSTVSFPQIDEQLSQLPYSVSTIIISFGGVYDDTPTQRIEGGMTVKIISNELANARQVKIDFDGEVFSGSATDLTAVRIRNNFYMINPNGVCINDETQVRDISNLTAGQLIGGVESAGPTGQQEVVDNLYPSWQYGFAPEAIIPPQIQTAEALDVLTGTLWVIPELQIANRYIVETNVQNATLLFGDRAVSGRLRYEYNVSQINVEQNISVPNGC